VVLTTSKAGRLANFSLRPQGGEECIKKGLPLKCSPGEGELSRSYLKTGRFGKKKSSRKGGVELTRQQLIFKREPSVTERKPIDAGPGEMVR